MFSIDSDGATSGFPTPEADGATTGFFQKGDPGTGTEATQVSADWLNAVQEELLNTIRAAGLSPSKTNRTQLLTAIQSLSLSSVSTIIPPIGSIIPFYDYNGGLTFDTSKWKYCDGSTVTIAGIGSQTLPDLSNRYLVGFGTEGGGDIDSAAWATSPVGNSGHTVNLQHSHTVNSHTHDLGNHNHDVGTLQFKTMQRGVSGALQGYDISGALSAIGSGVVNFTTGGASSVMAASTSGLKDYYTTSGTGDTGGPSTNTSGTASPGTDSQLSTTQSIQPRSVRVRHIMRVA